MYVIAGATGHVGSVVAQGLLDRKEKVKVIVRDATKGEAWSKRGAEVAVGGLDDTGFLTSALKGATGFFVLLPPNYAAPDFPLYQRELGSHIANAVKASGVPHVVLLSSLGADLATGNGPIKGLHVLENALRATGTKLTALRASYFQENIANSIGRAEQAGIYASFGPANYPAPMIATKDIADAALEALLSPPKSSEIVDLVGPSYSHGQVAEQLGKLLGKALKVVEVPQAEWVPTLKQAMPPSIASEFAEMYGAFAKGAITPKGARTVQGKTKLEDVLPGLVKQQTTQH